MNIYVYNSTISTNTYSTGDYGSISSPVTESIDYSIGLSLPAQTTVNYSTQNYLSIPDFSLTTTTFDSTLETFDVSLYEDFGYIYNTSTITPFGNISASGGLTGEAVTFHYTAPQATLPIAGNSLSALVKVWVGNGTLFEIGSGLERTISSYLSSGTLRIGSTAAATALESVTKSYNESSIYVPLQDYGNVSDIAHQALLDYGAISEFPSATSPYDNYGLITQFDFSPVLPFVPGISLSGLASAISFSANPSENTQLFIISGSALEKNTDSYVGIGTVTISGSITEKNTDSYFGLGTVNISGSALEAYSAQTPEDTQLFNIYGELNPPNIYYIPHYGIDKNIGIGTTGIQLSIFSRNYSNVYPGSGGGLPDNPGIGTITLSKSAVTRAVLPYKAQGYISIGATANESFSVANYDGSGIYTLSGISSTRKISVYGYYGDDNNPGTSGTIFISQQTSTTIEIEVDSYNGFGQIDVSGTSSILITNSFNGSGSIVIRSSASHAYSAQTPENTQLFSVSGSALEAYSAQTPEDTVLYTFSNQTISENITKSYDAIIDNITIGGQSDTSFTPSYNGSGTIRLVSRSVDHDYDTCDSEEFTCDNQDSAFTSLVANPVENTILFNISGSASTSETDLHVYSGSGSEIIYGSYTDLKRSYSEIGFGNIFAFNGGVDSEREVYIGSGRLFALSGGSQSYSAQTPENTIIINISGSAISNVEFEYSYIGIGQFNISGISSTRKINVYSDSGIGTISIFGNLVYPNIQFIPSPDGTGTINIIGSSNQSISKRYYQTTGSLFTISEGQQSFTYSGYIGFGTIYTTSVSASTIDNPFQIPRIYVSII